MNSIKKIQARMCNPSLGRVGAAAISMSLIFVSGCKPGGCDGDNIDYSRFELQSTAIQVNAVTYNQRDKANFSRYVDPDIGSLNNDTSVQPYTFALALTEVLSSSRDAALAWRFSFFSPAYACSRPRVPYININGIKTVDVYIVSSNNPELSEGVNVTDQFSIVTTRGDSAFDYASKKQDLVSWNLKDKDVVYERFSLKMDRYNGLESIANDEDVSIIGDLVISQPETFPEGDYVFKIESTRLDGEVYTANSSTISIQTYDQGVQVPDYHYYYKPLQSLMCDPQNTAEQALLDSYKNAGALGSASINVEALVDEYDGIGITCGEDPSIQLDDMCADANRLFFAVEASLDKQNRLLNEGYSVKPDLTEFDEIRDCQRLP